MKTYRDLTYAQVENFADKQQLNIDTPENFREAAIELFNRNQMKQVEKFLLQPGINIAGICSEAGITQQYLNRCRKAGELPGSKVMAKLLPVMVKYGFKN